MTDKASAPACSQAWAISTISVTFGLSFTIKVLFVAARQAATTDAAHRGSVPKTIPPCLTFGQEILISRAATSSMVSSRAANVAYSSGVYPKKLTIAGVLTVLRNGTFFVMNASIPTFCRPIAFSIPPGVSTIRGVGLPARGASESPLVTKAPIDSRSR